MQPTMRIARRCTLARCPWERRADGQDTAPTYDPVPEYWPRAIQVRFHLTSTSETAAWNAVVPPSSEMMKHFSGPV